MVLMFQLSEFRDHTIWGGRLGVERAIMYTAYALFYVFLYVYIFMMFKVYSIYLYILYIYSNIFIYLHIFYKDFYENF